MDMNEPKWNTDEPAHAMREFGTGATRDSDINKIDYQGFLSPYALEGYGKYMLKHQFQADGAKRASDNWKKGIPMKEYTKSLYRHHMEFQKEWEEGNVNEAEEVAYAMLFNIFGWLHELRKPKDGGPSQPAGSAVADMLAKIPEQYRQQMALPPFDPYTGSSI